MRHRIGISAGLAISVLLTTATITAQQRGAAGAPMAPARPISGAVAPAIIHAPVRAAAPVSPVHPAAPLTSSGMHPTAPRVPVRPISPKAPAHNRPGQGNTTRTNGHYFAPFPSAEDDNGIPGLGFDYPHYAATHPNAGRHRVNEGSVFPFIGGGIYIPSFGYVAGGAPTEVASEPALAESEETTAEAIEPNVEERPPLVPSAKSRPRETLAPSTDYVFVRRDGTVFFAVAYSWANDSLQYVTQDGVRKLVPIVTLDLDATTQFNEQRGVVFHSPA